MQFLRGFRRQNAPVSPPPSVPTGVALNYLRQYVESLPSHNGHVYLVPLGSVSSTWRAMDKIWELAKTINELSTQATTTVSWGDFALILPKRSTGTIPTEAYRWALKSDILNGKISLQELYQLAPVHSSVPEPVVPKPSVIPAAIPTIPTIPTVPPPVPSIVPQPVQPGAVLTPSDVFAIWSPHHLEHMCENGASADRNLEDPGLADAELLRTLLDEFGPDATARQMFGRLIDLSMYEALIDLTEEEARGMIAAFTGWRRLIEVKCPRAFILQFDWSWLVGARNGKIINKQLKTIHDQLWRDFQVSRVFPSRAELLRLMNARHGRFPKSVRERLTVLPRNEIGKLMLSYPKRPDDDDDEPSEFDTASVSQIREIVANTAREDWPFTDDFAATFCARYGNKDTCHVCRMHDYVSVSKFNGGNRQVKLCDSCMCNEPSAVPRRQGTGPAAPRVRIDERRNSSRSVSFAAQLDRDSEEEDEPFVPDPIVPARNSSRSNRQSPAPAAAAVPPPAAPSANIVLPQVHSHLNDLAASSSPQFQQLIQPLQDVQALQVSLMRLLLGRPLDPPTRALIHQQLGDRDRGTLDIVFQNQPADLNADAIQEVVQRTVNAVVDRIKPSISSVDEAQWLSLAQKANEAAKAFWTQAQDERTAELRGIVRELQAEPAARPNAQELMNALDASGVKLNAESRADIVREVVNQLRTTQSLANPQRSAQAVVDNVPPAATVLTQADLNNITTKIEELSRSLVDRDQALEATIRAELNKLPLASKTDLDKVVKDMAKVAQQMNTHTEVRQRVSHAARSAAANRPAPQAGAGGSTTVLTLGQINGAFRQQLDDIQMLIESPEFAAQIAGQLEMVVQKRDSTLDERLQNVLKKSPVVLDAPAFVKLVSDQLTEILPTKGWVQEQFRNLQNTIPQRPGAQDVEENRALQYIIQRLERDPSGTPLTEQRLRQIIRDAPGSASSETVPVTTAGISPGVIRKAVDDALDSYKQIQNQRFEQQLLHASSVEHSLAELSIRLDNLNLDPSSASSDPRTAEVMQTAVRLINELPKALLTSILGNIEGLRPDSTPADVLDLAAKTSRQWRSEQEARWQQVLQSNILVSQQIQEQQMAIQELTANFEGSTRVLTARIQNIVAHQAREFAQQQKELTDVKEQLTRMPSLVANSKPVWLEDLMSQMQKDQTERDQLLIAGINAEFTKLETRLQDAGYRFVVNQPPVIGANQPPSSSAMRDTASPAAAIQNVDADRLRARVEELTQQLAEHQNQLQQGQNQLDQLKRDGQQHIDNLQGEGQRQLDAAHAQIQHIQGEGQRQLDAAHAQLKAVQDQLRVLQQQRDEVESKAATTASSAAQEHTSQLQALEVERQRLAALNQQLQQNNQQLGQAKAASDARLAELERQVVTTTGATTTEQQRLLGLYEAERKRAADVQGQLQVAEAQLQRAQAQVAAETAQYHQNVAQLNEQHAQILAQNQAAALQERQRLEGERQALATAAEAHVQQLTQQFEQNIAAQRVQFTEQIRKELEAQKTLLTQQRNQALVEANQTQANRLNLQYKRQMNELEGQAKKQIQAFEQRLAQAQAQTEGVERQLQATQAEATGVAQRLQQTQTVEQQLQQRLAQAEAQAQRVEAGEAQQIQQLGQQILRLQSQHRQEQAASVALRGQLAQLEQHAREQQAEIEQRTRAQQQQAQQLLAIQQSQQQQQQIASGQPQLAAQLAAPINTSPASFTSQDAQSRVLQFLQQTGLNDPVDPYGVSADVANIVTLGSSPELASQIVSVGAKARQDFVSAARSFWELTIRSPPVLQFLSYAWHPAIHNGNSPRYTALFRQLESLQLVDTNTLRAIWRNSAFPEGNTNTVSTVITWFNNYQTNQEPGAALRLLELLRDRSQSIQQLIPTDLNSLVQTSPLDTSIYTWFTAAGASSNSQQYTISNHLRSVHVSTQDREYLFGPFTSVNNDNEILGKINQRLRNGEQVMICQVGQKLLRNIDKVLALLSAEADASGFVDNGQVLFMQATIVTNVGVDETRSTHHAFQIDRNPDQRQNNWRLAETTSQAAQFVNDPAQAVYQSVQWILGDTLKKLGGDLICLVVDLRGATNGNPRRLCLASFYEPSHMSLCPNDDGSCFMRRGAHQLAFNRTIYHTVNRLVERMNTETGSSGEPARPEFLNICAPILCRPDAGPCFNTDDSASLLDWSDLPEEQASASPIERAVGVLENVSALFVHVDVDPSHPADITTPSFTSQGRVTWRYSDVHRLISRVNAKDLSAPTIQQLLRELVGVVVGVRTVEYYVQGTANSIRSAIEHDNARSSLADEMQEESQSADEMQEESQSADRMMPQWKTDLSSQIRRQQVQMGIDASFLQSLQTSIQQAPNPTVLLNLLSHTEIPGQLIKLSELTRNVPNVASGPNLGRVKRLLGVLMRAQTDAPIAGLDLLDTVAKLGTGHSMCLFGLNHNRTDAQGERSYDLSQSTFAVVVASIRQLFQR